MPPGATLTVAPMRHVAAGARAGLLVLLVVLSAPNVVPGLAQTSGDTSSGSTSDSTSSSTSSSTSTAAATTYDCGVPTASIQSCHSLTWFGTPVNTTAHTVASTKPKASDAGFFVVYVPDFTDVDPDFMYTLQLYYDKPADEDSAVPWFNIDYECVEPPASGKNIWSKFDGDKGTAQSSSSSSTSSSSGNTSSSTSTGSGTSSYDYGSTTEVGVTTDDPMAAYMSKSDFDGIPAFGQNFTMPGQIIAATCDGITKTVLLMVLYEKQPTTEGAYSYQTTTSDYTKTAQYTVYLGVTAGPRNIDSLLLISLVAVIVMPVFIGCCAGPAMEHLRVYRSLNPKTPEDPIFPPVKAKNGSCGKMEVTRYEDLSWQARCNLFIFRCDTFCCVCAARVGALLPCWRHLEDYANNQGAAAKARRKKIKEAKKKHKKLDDKGTDTDPTKTRVESDIVEDAKAQLEDAKEEAKAAAQAEARKVAAAVLRSTSPKGKDGTPVAAPGEAKKPEEPAGAVKVVSEVVNTLLSVVFRLIAAVSAVSLVWKSAFNAPGISAGIPDLNVADMGSMNWLRDIGLGIVQFPVFDLGFTDVVTESCMEGRVTASQLMFVIVMLLVPPLYISHAVVFIKIRLGALPKVYPKLSSIGIQKLPEFLEKSTVLVLRVLFTTTAQALTIVVTGLGTLMRVGLECPLGDEGWFCSLTPCEDDSMWLWMLFSILWHLYLLVLLLILGVLVFSGTINELPHGIRAKDPSFVQRSGIVRGARAILYAFLNPACMMAGVWTERMLRSYDIRKLANKWNPDKHENGNMHKETLLAESQAQGLLWFIFPGLGFIGTFIDYANRTPLYVYSSDKHPDISLYLGFDPLLRVVNWLNNIISCIMIVFTAFSASEAGMWIIFVCVVISTAADKHVERQKKKKVKIKNENKYPLILWQWPLGTPIDIENMSWEDEEEDEDEEAAVEEEEEPESGAKENLMALITAAKDLKSLIAALKTAIKKARAQSNKDPFKARGGAAGTGGANAMTANPMNEGGATKDATSASKK